jgi:GT2 family glycosyltransferase
LALFDVPQKVGFMNLTEATKVSVVIVTKNRVRDLHRAILSTLRQTKEVELLVVDDASTDGTAQMVMSEFPQVRLERAQVSLGYIAQRNRAASLCSGDVILSIDDDAEFSTPSIVVQSLRAFSDPRIAAVAIPYTEPHKSPQQFQVAPNTESIWLTDSFRGTAYALKRDVFLTLGGFREQLFHQGEEMDFCVRLLNRGYVVRLGVSDAIIHHEQPKRDWSRADFYGRRNDVLFAWGNVPIVNLPVHLLATTANGIAYAMHSAGPLVMMHGMLSGYAEIIKGWQREPVTRKTYRLHRLLKKKGPMKLSAVENLLPPMSAAIVARPGASIGRPAL